VAENLIGRTLLGGEYQITGILGRGGMATVYRAYSRSLETDVAVKVLAPALAGNAGFRERFHDEARSLASLHHPNLVEVHHYGEEGDLVYIVMRLVPGGTLKNRLEAIGGPLDLLSTARLISQVADALHLAHNRGLVHLDIKPANILLGRSDWPLLADFGITRAVRNLRSARGQERMAGTPMYMSPEQCRGGPVDGRSDQYSLAITAYEMLTGRRPFQAETTEALLQHHIEDSPPRPREINPGIPGPAEDVLLRALSKVPEDRFPTIREFGDALSDVAERTRGVSLETKAALAKITPNFLAIFALMLVGPAMVATLPGAAFFDRRVPLAWPFQVVLSLLVAGLLLGIRWHLIGLITRALNSFVDAMVALGGAIAPGVKPPEPLEVKRWRNSVVASAEGAVNLLYLVVIYRLIAVPVLGMVGAVVGQSGDGLAVTAITVVVVLLGLGIVVGIYRSGGPVVAGLVLGGCWAFVNALPVADVATVSGFSLAWTVKAVVGFGALVLLLATRPQTQTVVRRLSLASLGRLVAEMRPGASPDEVTAAREQIVRVIGATFDFVYLLTGYALLRTPLLAVLQDQTGLLAAAILVSGVAAVFWLLLTLRLNANAGGAGLALGILLGAPLLVSLPFLEARVMGAGWPATVAGWIVGTILILLLAAMRSRVQDVGRDALGPAIDRRLLGANAARTEDHSQRRIRALGGVVGALLDVGFLVLAYWILGVPAATAIGRVTGRSEVGSILLGALVVAAISLMLGPLHHAIVTVEETGGPRWSSRMRALPAFAAALVALLVAGCAAAPLALAAPDVAGGIALQASPPSTVVVDWEHWLPWTPTQTEATFDISLSCADGRKFGQFREAFRVPNGTSMPTGSVGQRGPTNVSCDNWPAVYFAQRRAAGLPPSPTVSLDWLDVHATVRPDRSVDVVETHRVLFTFGSYQRLSWSLVGGAQQISNLRVLENGVPYPINPAQPGDRYARTSVQGGQSIVTWWFPPVASPAERVFTIEYRLKEGVQPHGAGYRFERLVLPPSHLGPTWRTTVEVTLPGSFQSSAVQLSSTGVPARYGMVDSRTASFDSADAPVGTGLDVIVDFPSLGTTSGPPATPTSTPTPTPNLTATAEALQRTSNAASATAAANRPATATATPALTVTATPTASATLTTTSTPTITVTASVTPTPSVTRTALPSATATATTAPVAKSCAPVPVLAMYYDWYDMNTWTSGTTSDQPVTPYVSADRATIERQVTQAQGVGIDGFEVNWWGPGNQTDTNLQTLLAVARSHGFKVTADFDLNSPFVHSADDVANDLKYLQRYYSDPSWFRYNGKPYVVFYGTRKYDVSTWGTILHQVDPNHQVLWIAEGDIFSYLNVFDGIHPYSVAWSPNPSSQLASYASRTRAYPGKIWMATVMPGYNDKLARGAQGFAVDRQNGAYYTTMWAGAMATHPDVLSITSFNEWVEGSQMEPSKTYGDLYLQLTQQMVAKYRNVLHPCG
jgi:hypothetical protein